MDQEAYQTISEIFEDSELDFDIYPLSDPAIKSRPEVGFRSKIKVDSTSQSLFSEMIDSGYYTLDDIQKSKIIFSQRKNNPLLKRISILTKYEMYNYHTLHFRGNKFLALDLFVSTYN